MVYHVKSAGLFFCHSRNDISLLKLLLILLLVKFNKWFRSLWTIYIRYLSLLREQDINMPDISERLSIIRQPFAFLETEYMQLKYLKKLSV